MNRQGQLKLVVALIISIFLGFISRNAQAEQYGYCTNLNLEDIPYGDFSTFTWPQQKEDGTPVFRITQVYDQPEADKWPSTNQETGVTSWFWGHDGIDVHEAPKIGPGINYNVAIQGGKVIAAMEGYKRAGWGYRTTIATRIPYSHQIITANYGHMHPGSLLFKPCDNIQQGERIGLEGETGWATAAHLHLTVRIWDSIEHLNAALAKDDGATDDKKGGGGLFQHGYVRNNDSRLENYLSPYELITNKFLEFECNNPGCPTWAKAHALAARRAGVDFGRFDGYFALDTTDSDPQKHFVEKLTRGESARWFKVARRFITETSTQADFTDIPEDSIHSPYVQTLVKNGVLSSGADCDPNNPGKQWCPDINRTRAEFIKMVIETFMSSEFTQWQNEALAGQHKDLFDDVHNDIYFQDLSDTESDHWATTYILFAAFAETIPSEIRPVNEALSFRPEDPIDKLEAAKMLMTAREWFFQKYGQDSQYNLCDYHYCNVSEKCVVLPQEGDSSPYYATCLPIPACVPEEGGRDDCAYGGGIIGDPPHPCDTPQCTPNNTQTQDCGNGGEQISTCTDECEWGPWGSCEGGGSCQPNAQQPCGNCGTMTCGSNGQWGSCLNQGVCSPNATQDRTCNDVGMQTKTCNGSCAWSGWGTCSAECTPGQQPQTQSCTTGGQSGTQTRNCNGSGQWGSWGTCVSNCQCSSGTCCDSCNYRPASYPCNSWTEYQCAGSSPGQDGQYQQVQKYCSGSSSSCSGQSVGSGWQTYSNANCSSSEVCVMSGGTPQCVSSCTDTYKASASVACWSQTNPQNVEICLHLSQKNGSLWEYQVCKQGGSFQNSYGYEIIDINNSSHYLHASTGSSGSSCSGWHDINMSYISSYGQSNGASLRGQLYSPSGCSQSGCFFRSSLITLWKECQ